MIDIQINRHTDKKNSTSANIYIFMLKVICITRMICTDIIFIH